MEPLSRPYSHHDDARRLTGDLRTSDEPRWAAVRQHLIESGFDPQRSAVGDLFPEDVGDFGVLVASDRTTHTFEVGTQPIRGERGKYRIWVTHTETTSARSCFAYVEVAERERHRAEAAEFLSRRLQKLAAEREKLLRAYYADAIDVAILKREQARINAEVAEAESQLAIDGGEAGAG